MASYGEASAIEYHRIRVPREDGSTLEIPPLPEFDRLWQANLELISRRQSQGHPRLPSHIGSWSQWQATAREEIRLASIEHSSAYLASDVIDAIQKRSSNRILMTGHQPELFHPGVWFKNFALSRLATTVDAVPINLVVDSDLCTQHGVTVPMAYSANTSNSHPNRTSPSHPRLRFGSVAFDHPAVPIPFENRTIVDRQQFDSFPQRARAALSHDSGSPDLIVDQLWDCIKRVGESLPDSRADSLGTLFAAGRHLLESDSGLKTLELPVSRLSQTRAFAEFVGSVVFDAKNFQLAYNQALDEYRRVHRVRSSAHPVPALDSKGDRIEVPFWIWTDASQQRTALFARVLGDKRVVLEGGQFKQAFEASEFVEQFARLHQIGVHVRPRALATTMFSRMLLSDTFLHGIGGAKYDQLTDAIAADFYGIELPGYMTLSATCHLQTDQPLVTARDVTDLKVQRREQRFHPERFIVNPTPEVDRFIREKADWIHGSQRSVRSKEKHQAIDRVNVALQKSLPVSDEQLAEMEKEAQLNLRDSRIASSREYSFCLFEESLIDYLKLMASDR